MGLRDALDLCTDAHEHEWVEMPGSQSARPATTMLAGLFDPGFEEPKLRPLTGDSIAVYEPDARLSIVWPVPDDDESDRRSAHSNSLPEWAEADDHDWDHALPGWAVVLLEGVPIWQQLIWYLSWGSRIGGYVSDFRPAFAHGGPGGGPRDIERWETSAWAVGLARLINSFSHTRRDFESFDPTPRLVPQPAGLHPVDAARSDY